MADPMPLTSRSGCLRGVPRLAWILVALALGIVPMAAAAPPRPGNNAFLNLANERGFGDLPDIRKRGFLRVLVVHNKTHYLVDRGREYGISHDMIREFEKRLNADFPKKTKQYVPAVFIPVHRDEIFTRLRDGRGDIAVANLTHTPEREAYADFSVPFLENVREIVASSPRAPPVTTIEDLAGRTMFLRRSTSFRTHVEAVNADFAARGLRPIRISDADDHLEPEDLLEMLDAGLIDYTVIDQHIGDAWAGIFRRMRLHPDIPIAGGQSIAWALRKGTPALKALVDEYMKTHRAGTATGNTVLRHYLSGTRWVKSATHPDELARFERTIGFFRRYAPQYSFDPLMLAAQGYQESGLDQNRRSRVGAVGVMQLMPATGRELKVGDIHLEESNIHGGAKYMRRLIDTYFSDPQIGELDRTLFAFAAYNAGPGRIASLRREAARAGLDPNRWFHHVETVAAQRIGRETTQYVANIAKYYIAYKLVEEQARERQGSR